MILFSSYCAGLCSYLIATQWIRHPTTCLYGFSISRVQSFQALNSCPSASLRCLLLVVAVLQGFKDAEEAFGTPHSSISYRSAADSEGSYQTAGGGSSSDLYSPARMSFGSFHSASAGGAGGRASSSTGDAVTPPRLSISSFQAAAAGGDGTAADDAYSSPTRKSSSSFHTAGAASGSGSDTESYKTPMKVTSPGPALPERLAALGVAGPAAAASAPKGGSARRALGFGAEPEGGVKSVGGAPAGDGGVSQHRQERQWSIEQWVDDVRSKARVDQAEELAAAEARGGVGTTGTGAPGGVTSAAGVEVEGEGPHMTTARAPASESGASLGGRSAIEAIRAETVAAAAAAAAAAAGVGEGGVGEEMGGSAVGGGALKRQESAVQYPQAFRPRFSLEGSARPSLEGSEATGGNGQ